MSRLARVALAIVGITVTVASSALPTAMPTIPNATSTTVPTTIASTASDAARLLSSSTAGDTAATTSSDSDNAAIPTSGTQHVYVEVVSATATTSDDVNTINQSDAEALVASLNTYWSGESDGAVSIDFAGFESSSANVASCDAASLFASEPTTAFGGMFADEAWRGTGNHLLILTAESCGSNAQGSVGGDGGVILSGNGTGSSLGGPVVFHEFGHNLGFGHAGSSICRSNITTDAATADFGSSTSLCPTDEYGDPLDIMGYSIAGAAPHLSTPQRIKSGWLSDYTNITSADSTVTTTVTSLDGGVGNRALRVVDPNTGTVYYVEYRTASGADATSTEFTGSARCAVISDYIKCSGGVAVDQGSVRILRELPYRNYTDYVRTTVVAVGSTDSASTRTTRFAVGDTFASSGGGVYITLNSASPSAGASLTVRFTPPATTATTISLTPKSTQTYGTSADITVKANVASSDGTAASGVVTFLDGKNVIARTTVVNSVASVAIPASFPVGTHKITASFTPSTGDSTASAAAVKKLVVKKSAAKVAVSVKRHKATITVKAAGKKATGTVRIYVDGKKLATKKLGKKATSVKIPASAKKVVVKYAGSKTIKATTVTKKLVTKK